MVPSSDAYDAMVKMPAITAPGITIIQPSRRQG